MRQISLDTETTGLDPKKGHRIIEIGGVELINRRLTGNNFHLYINPERSIDEGALAVHGISEEFLADKPIFTDIIQDFIHYIDGAQLIIHNADFDVGFLNHEFALAGKKFRSIEFYSSVEDTLRLARNKHPGQKNNLDALCQRYDINNNHRQLHGALLDAEILAQVYLAMTGGQGSLFAEDSDQKLKQETHFSNKKLSSNMYDLPVIAASDVESLAHQQYLELIKEKSGQCLWLQDDNASE